MKIFVLILSLAATAVVVWRAWHRLRHFLHMAQLHGYKPHEFAEWLFDRGRRLIVRPSHFVALLLLLGAFSLATTNLSSVSVVVMAVWIIIFASAADYLKSDTKKPLHFTARMKRLVIVSGVVALLIALLAATFSIEFTDRFFIRYAAGLALLDLIAPIAALLGLYVTKPVEWYIQNGFKKQARRKLKSMPHLKIIAITGSYGKTSVKFAIAEVLRQRFNVLATPGSFNTPMGICLVINRDLKPEHQVLVLEMGARYRGDIQELCNIAKPDIGIVTNVGIAHLETFGDRDTIALEKGTLIENVPADGLAILNGDDPRVRNMQSRTNAEVVFAGLESDDSELHVANLSYNAHGASFELSDNAGNSSSVKTSLIGKHNIFNILLGAVVGHRMGLRLRQIAHSIERLEPVEHRLKIRTQGEVTIIDDAFNSNPVGAKNAVEMLGLFRDGKRIIVTPGMIELGDRQDEENRMFGAVIAGNADVVVLVGDQQTRAIQQGLHDQNYPQGQTHIFSSLKEAQNFLGTILEPGDTVLYENDLPDQFDEAS